MYIGTVENPAYVGPSGSIAALARHIYKSSGPSGENKEYSTVYEDYINAYTGIYINWPKH